jgi:hypothetical protein
MVLIAMMAAAFSAGARPGVPTLDELAADWMKVDDIQNQPSVNSFSGGIKTDQNLLGIRVLTCPPYSQGAESTATFSLDRQRVRAEESRWFPYQVLRRAHRGAIEMETTVRMVFERDGVLFRARLKNTGSQPQALNVGVELLGNIRRYDGTWSWDPPRPRPSGFEAMVTNAVLLVRDTRSTACTAYAFTVLPESLHAAGDRGQAAWSFTLAPGESRTVDFAMAVTDAPASASATASRWAGSFAACFSGAQTLWERRWQDAFTPGNGHYSGNAPVLLTPDAKLRRVYYHGILTVLLAERTTLPISPRVYLTAGPEWGSALEYFWDTGLWSPLFALLDPAMMRDHLRGFLTLDYYHCYARCFLSGGPAGPWYSCNDYALFTLFWNYLTTTGDWDFLHETAGGRTILEHMDRLAWHWKSLIPANGVLGDYGGADNLLECVPTYINQVPSLNAANVWMMRCMAGVHEHLNDFARARQFRGDAHALAAKVLTLYVPDQGVWNCIHDDGTKVQVRHCWDYITVGQTMTPDLSATVKTEMTAFVERELLVPGWMRAQSLNDPAAKDSDRSDHGPYGAYDAWPALTALTMCSFSQYDQALHLVRQCEGVTREGPFAQSHRLLPLSRRPGASHAAGAASGGPNDVYARIAGEQDYNEICGSAFASGAIIRGLFGCQPELNGKLTVTDVSMPRGFEGQLTGVRQAGGYYEIISGAQGLILGKGPDGSR